MCKGYIMKANEEGPCPCNSGNAYENCCKILHDGVKKADNALMLMRSRYSAYAKQNAEYIIKTTHPNNEEYSNNLPQWSAAIDHFMNNTDFIDLNVHDFSENNNEAFVIFQAVLNFKGEDCSFTERSRFIKENERWYYESGEIFEQI